MPDYDDVLQRQLRLAAEFERNQRLIAGPGTGAPERSTVFDETLRAMRDAEERSRRIAPATEALRFERQNVVDALQKEAARAARASKDLWADQPWRTTGFERALDAYESAARLRKRHDYLTAFGFGSAVHIAGIENAYEQLKRSAAFYSQVQPVALAIATGTDRLARLASESARLQRTAREAEMFQGMIAHAAQVHDLHMKRAISGEMNVYRLAGSVERLSLAVGRVWDTMAIHPEQLAVLPLTLREAPTMQVYAASRGTELLITRATGGVRQSLDDDAGVADADRAVQEWSGTSDEMAHRLDRVHSGFGSMYRGALQALSAQRDDFARHVASSLRELLHALLEQLAPDAVVIAWHKATPPANVPLYDGQTRKLTHAVRLAFTFREVSPAYAQFVNDERKLIQQSFYALNDGVHTVASLSPKELTWLTARVQGHFHSILVMAGY